MALLVMLAACKQIHYMILRKQITTTDYINKQSTLLVRVFYCLLICGILKCEFLEVSMADLGGKPPAFKSPDEFEERAMKYIQWVKDNPVMKTITASFQGEINYRKVPHMRGMTQFGLASFMGVGLSTLKDYGKKPAYSAIYGRIDTIMKSWNLDGALSGDLNHALVARIDGHADKTETDITTNGESINKPTTIELVAPNVENAD